MNEFQITDTLTNPVVNGVSVSPENIIVKMDGKELGNSDYQIERTDTNAVLKITKYDKEENEVPKLTKYQIQVEYDIQKFELDFDDVRVGEKYFAVNNKAELLYKRNGDKEVTDSDPSAAAEVYIQKTNEPYSVTIKKKIKTPLNKDSVDYNYEFTSENSGFSGAAEFEIYTEEEGGKVLYDSVKVSDGEWGYRGLEDDEKISVDGTKKG